MQYFCGTRRTRHRCSASPAPAFSHPLLFEIVGPACLSTLPCLSSSASVLQTPLQCKQSTYGDRAISVLGLFVFQTAFFLSSKNRSAIPWPTVIVGLFMQQAIALFVLKSGAGFSIFKWIATLASDFLSQGLAGAQFFFNADVIQQFWFFVNTVSVGAAKWKKYDANLVSSSRRSSSSLLSCR